MTFSKPSSGLPVKLMLSHDDSLLRKFSPFCFGADLITQGDLIKYFIFNRTIAYIIISENVLTVLEKSS